MPNEEEEVIKILKNGGQQEMQRSRSERATRVEMQRAKINADKVLTSTVIEKKLMIRKMSRC